MPAADPHEEYRPTPPYQRVLIALLAAATSVTVMLTMLAPQMRRLLQPRPDVAACTVKEFPGCVGGKQDVTLIDAAASAASAASAP
jgi:hypothetical protein